MRRLFALSIVAAAALVWHSAPATAQDSGLRIAYINSEQILQEAPGAQQARQTLEEQVSEYRVEVQEMEARLDSLFTVYDQSQVMLSPEARRTLLNDIREAQREYQQRLTELEEEAAQRQAELLEPITARIDRAITEIREEEGYHLIFDAARGGLVAAASGLDITDRVLRRLRSTAQQAN